MPDPRHDYAELAHGFADLVRRIPDDAWTGPGLGVWDVRALVGHTSRSLVTVDTYLDRPAATVDIETPEAYYRFTAPISSGPEVAERGRLAGVALGDDPARTVADLVDRVLARVPADDPVIETIGGGMRLSDYLPTRSFELTVHGFDIATATGIAPPTPSPEVLGRMIALAGRVAVLGGSGPAVIGALTGRRPLPPGYSVV